MDEMNDEISRLLEEYDDLEFSDDETGSQDPVKLYLQKFQNKVDFSMKSGWQMKDKSDRATTDHALDRRSRAILFKMMNQEIFSEINGCISTGKEANIYHVIDKDNTDLAIKVYMTSIMPFKCRDKYVKGDFRMRHGYSKATSWKLVSKWTEKEYRNLIRINQSGLIPCPTPLRLKGVVLLMSFVGKNGIPAPKLKDACFIAPDDDHPAVEWPRLYAQVVNDVRTLYQKCRLVHADLSEYNLLYMDDKVWMIDVSQSVEHESPQALDYLRSDCYNVNTFFRKQGVTTLTLREFFEWVVNPSLPAPDDPASHVYLQQLLQAAQERGFHETIEVEDSAFRYVHIPRNLQASYPFVRDFLRLQIGKLTPSEVYYAAVSGMKQDLSGAQTESDLLKVDALNEEEHSRLSASENEDANENSENESGQNNQPTRTSQARPRNESPASRKLRKKTVKEHQAERRKTKIPKHVKRHRTKK
ncbi:Serine/threonine-protein kinase [Fasciola hepatica]|uniref:Serine/threonine-protein kinase RIO1 n=1 Tax=Fasciola hepatica TaxID=6192 RepID=A0A4E0R9J6_FASHE|nr:Serine/threonine-protein kinase [Fasciola hepatica]